MTPPLLTRRRALVGTAGAGVGLPLLAACNGGDGTTTAADPATTAPPSTTEPTSGPTSEPTSGPTSGTTAAAITVDGTVVPVGSGVILLDPQVVVTQPTAGDVKVFSSICTHTGCPVAQVTDVITCPCHGSRFDLTTGGVLGGPASGPLAAVDFTVEGDQVVIA